MVEGVKKIAEIKGLSEDEVAALYAGTNDKPDVQVSFSDLIG